MSASAVKYAYKRVGGKSCTLLAIFCNSHSQNQRKSVFIDINNCLPSQNTDKILNEEFQYNDQLVKSKMWSAEQQNINDTQVM